MTTPDEIHAAIAADLGHDDQVVMLERGPHYVQFLFDQNDGVVAEAVSNEFLEGEARLGAEQCAQLLRLGWRPPIATCDDPQCTEGTHPNFWRYWPAPVDPAQLTMMAEQTFATVFYCGLDAVDLG